MDSPGQNSSASLLGVTLAGVYQVEGWLGSGGMGDVYRVRHLRTFGTFAIKVLRRQMSNRPELYTRLRAEALIASALRHPNIAHIVDLGELPDGRPFIVMEHLLGEDLQKRLARGAIPFPEALRILRQVAAGLHVAHCHFVVHRDIKPSNIFLVESEDHDVHVKIIDFGIARMQGGAGPASATPDHQILGTTTYMAPEAELGLQSEVDARTDQYALAKVMYRMLGASTPGSGTDATVAGGGGDLRSSQTLPRLLPEANGALLRALSPRKEDRYPTVLEFIKALVPASSATQRLVSSDTPRLTSSDTPRLTSSDTLPVPSPPIDLPGKRALGGRVLVVDDDLDILGLLREVLLADGLTCRLVNDGNLVMSLALDFQPDVVLLDIGLPGQSGFKLCWELKQAPELLGVRVLLISGKGSEADYQLGRAMGADAYLTKPFSMEVLLGAVRAHLP